MSGAEDPRSLLRELEQRARKRFGQHFLAKPSVVRRMVRAAKVVEGDRVVEIGPGLGILTEAILGAGAELVAVEIDDDLYARMREVYPEVATHHLDATKADWGELTPGSGWKMVANLPYNVGTQLVMDAARRPGTFRSATVMLQAEVVARMTATPGTKQYGSLSVHLQSRGAARWLFDVPPGSFVPPPKVNSAIVHVDFFPEPDVGGVDPRFFDRVVTAAFSQRRKTLRNSLGGVFGKTKAVEAMERAGINPGLRAEVLDLDAFRALASQLHHS